MSEGPSVVTTRDGSRTLAAASGRRYKSSAGALTEALAVYLLGSGVAARLEQGLPTSVLEVGFGAGLNYLVTAAEAERTGAELTYAAIERALPPGELLAELRYAELLRPASTPTAFLRWRGLLGPKPDPGWHEFVHGPVTLRLFIGDALTGVWDRGAEWRAHAVYHDAFSPADEPELWTPAFLARLAPRLAPGGRLVSFTVAGGVRRALEARGLSVTKAPGPAGGKREVLVARLPGPENGR